MMRGLRIDLIGELAKEVMGRPDAHLAALSSLTVERDGIAAVRVELRDAPLLKTGKNAGRPNWRKSTNSQYRVILHAELERLAAAWSERTGKCIERCGTGRLFVRWSSTDGTTYRSCPACNDGTINAPVAS